MKSVLSLICVFALITHCSPRDDESLIGSGGNRGGFDLKSGQTLRVTEQGQKLSSCDQDDDPTWDTIRLFAELSFMFNKVNDLKVIVGKGSRNCVKVSDQDAVEIVLQDAPQSKNYDSSGAFYHVTKLEMMNTQDFLNNAGMVSDMAGDMGMSADQLKSFLAAEPKRDQITITYLKKADGSTSKPGPKKEEFQLAKGDIITTTLEGNKLPSCRDEKDPTWQTIRLPFELSALADKLETVSVVVGKGSRNCVAVSSENTIELELQEQEGGNKYKKLGAHYMVDSLMMINTSDLIDSELLAEAAQGMALEVNQLKEYLTADPMPEIVTVAYLTPSEKKSQPLSNPVKIAKLPEANGTSFSDCGGNFWTSVRVGEGLKEKIMPAVTDKTLKAIVGPGDRNCLQIGGEGVISFKTDTGWEDDTNKFKVISVTVRDKDNFISDPILAELVGAQMALSLEDFTSVLNGFNKNQVNITRIEWIEAQ